VKTHAALKLVAIGSKRPHNTVYSKAETRHVTYKSQNHVTNHVRIM